MIPPETKCSQDSYVAQLKKQLQEITEQHNLIINHSDAAYVFLSPEYVIQWSTLPHYTNHPLVLKYKPGEVCYKVVRKINRPCSNCIAKQAMESLQPCTKIGQLEDGTSLELAAYPIFQNESTLKGILMRIKNISESQRANEQLKESQIKNKLILKIGNISTWEYDIQTRTFLTDDIESVIYPSIKDTELYNLIHPTNLKRLKACIENLAQGNNENFDITLQLFTKDEYSWRRIIGTVYKYDKKNKPLSLIGLRIDIEKEVKLRKQAEEVNRIKTAFIANMSHEIRTPLNAIIGFSELIVHSSSLEEREHFMKIIRDNNQRLLQLTNDVLLLADIESGEMEISIQPTNVNDMLLRWKRRLTQEAKEKQIEISVLKGSEKCIIHTDGLRLSNIMYNLIDNAVKFTDEGNITIGYNFTDEKKNIRFYIKDTGKGISQEEQEIIFNRFYKSDSYIKGTGLGLSICESIIKALGGNIGVISQKGIGSEFWFTIPIVTSPPDIKFS